MAQIVFAAFEKMFFPGEIVIFLIVIIIGTSQKLISEAELIF
jgi:hypothetical protein